MANSKSDDNASFIIILSVLFTAGYVALQYFKPDLMNVVHQLFYHTIALLVILGIFVLLSISYTTKSKRDPEYLMIKDNVFIWTTGLIFLSVGIFILMLITKVYVYITIHVVYIIFILSLFLTFFTLKKLLYKPDYLTLKAEKIRFIPELSQLIDMVLKGKNLDKVDLDEKIVSLDKELLGDGISQVNKIPDSFVYKEDYPIYIMHSELERKVLNYDEIDKMKRKYRLLKVKSIEDYNTNPNYYPYRLLIDNMYKKLLYVLDDEKIPNKNKPLLDTRKSIKPTILLKKYKGCIEFVVLHLLEQIKIANIDFGYGQINVYRKTSNKTLNNRIMNLIGAMDNLASSNMKSTGLVLYLKYYELRKPEYDRRLKDK